MRNLILALTLIPTLALASPVIEEQDFPFDVIEPKPSQCLPGPNVDNILTQNYRETIYGEGLNGAGEYLYEVWFNPDSTTWTIVRTDGNNMKCIMATGVYWRLKVIGES